MMWLSRTAPMRPGPGCDSFVVDPGERARRPKCGARLSGAGPGTALRRFGLPARRWGARLLAACALVAGVALPAASATAGSLRTEQIRVGKEQRPYLILTPDGPPGPRPVVVALHGAMQTPESFRAYFGLDAAAEAHGFVAVYPEGDGRVWNDGRPAAMRLKAVLRPGDDVSFLVLLVRKLVAEGIADPNRIYLTGISNGGFMVQRMACEHATLFAAYSVIMATTPANYREECHPARPVPIMFIHGSADSVIAYDGFWTPVGATLSAPDSARLFARINGCSAEASRKLPDLDAFDGTSVSERRWSSCRDGADVVLMRVANGGHQPPVRVDTKPDLATPFLGLRSHDIDSGEEVWRFMSAFSLAPPAPAGSAMGYSGTPFPGGFAAPGGSAGRPAEQDAGAPAAGSPTAGMPLNVPLPVPVQRGISTQ